jgi:hypothetical protein
MAPLHLQANTLLRTKLIGYWVTTTAIALEALAGA